MYHSSVKHAIMTIDVSDSEGGYATFDSTKTSEMVYWQTCREIFAKVFQSDSEGFFFSSSPLSHKHIIEFLDLCETILDTNEKTKIIQTTNDNVILIIPSYFWKECYVKRSLLTLLLRMGFYHDDSHSWEKTMFSSDKNVSNSKILSNKMDIQKTENAIKRFFLGFTHFVGNIRNLPEYGPWKYGWVEEFQNRSKFEIKKLLVKNKISLEELLFSSHDGLATN